MSGSVESGRPTPIRTRWKSGEPSSRLSDFSPLWPARPPPRRARMSPNGRSISSCSDEHAVELELEGAAGGAGRTPRLVHVGLRLSTATRGPPGPRTSLGQLTRELLLRLGQVPAPRQLLRDLEADVVRRLDVAGPGVPEPDDQPVDRCGGEDLQDSSEEASASVAALGGLALGRPRRPRRPRRRARSRSRSRPSTGSSGRRSDRGDHGLLEVVEQRDALRRGDRGQRERVVDLHAGDVVRDRVRDVARAAPRC